MRESSSLFGITYYSLKLDKFKIHIPPVFQIIKASCG